MTTMHTSHRRSLWFGTTSPSSPSSSTEPLDFLKFHRYSTMPSASAIFEKLHDIGDIRPRSLSKGAKDGRPERRTLSKKDSVTNLLGSPKRLSTANSGLVGSIKGRLSRKRSSPLLSNPATFSEKSPIIESPTTPTGPGLPSLPMLSSPFDRYTLDDTLSPSNANFDASKVNYDEKAFRHLRRESDTESSLGDAVDISVSKRGYQALPLTKKERRILHPYPLKDAPSMRSYNKVDLENEAYFNTLLRRLNTTGTPVFHDMQISPATILDLGCGQGYWVAEASKYFAQYGTKIVGFDLVDMVSEELRDLPSVSWKRGNFVSYLLPFRSESFDLVRISNLSDCIPQSRWQHVLSEAYRVLKKNRRLEIIDDELMFSYVNRHPPEMLERSPVTSPGSSNVQTARSSWNSVELPAKAAALLGADEGKKNRDYRNSFLELDTDTDADEDRQSIAERASIGPVPSLYRGHSPSEASTNSEFLPTPTEDEPLGETRWRTPNLTFSSSSMSPVSTTLCQDVEGIYETMLEGRYDINPHPHESLLKLLLTTFGPGRSGLICDFRLSLLSDILDSLVSSTKESDFVHKDRKGRKLFSSKAEEDDSSDRALRDQVQTAEVQLERKSKAMKMLGMKDSPPLTPHKPSPDPMNSLFEESGETDEGEDATQHSRTSSSSSLPLLHSPDQPGTPRKTKHQPTGLFLYPDKFLDTSPRELEMYVGKHVQSVLGSHAALEEHVLDLQDDDGKPVINEEGWREMMWDYECSRYAHLNLPQNGDWDTDDLDQSDFSAGPRTLPEPVAQAIQKQTRAARTSSGAESPATGPSTLVRRIRVYEAVKRISPFTSL